MTLSDPNQTFADGAATVGPPNGTIRRSVPSTQDSLRMLLTSYGFAGTAIEKLIMTTDLLKRSSGMSKSVVTLKSILEKLSDWVKNEEVHSPSEWLDEAHKLSVLELDLYDELTKADIAFEEMVVDIQERNRDEKGKLLPRSHAEAKAKVEKRYLAPTMTMTIYEYRCYLENRVKTVDAVMQIAKKRAELRDW